MPSQLKNLIQGPMDVYFGTYDGTFTREPAPAAVNSTPASSAWTNAGATKDGAQLAVNLKFSEMTVDQLIDVAETRLVGRDLQVKSKLAEVTLANLKQALNGGAVVTGAGYGTYDPLASGLSTQPNYISVLLHGFAPVTTAGVIQRRMVILRKVLNIDAVTLDHKKDAATDIPVTYRCHAIDEVTAPFRIFDGQ